MAPPRLCPWRALGAAAMFAWFSARSAVGVIEMPAELQGTSFRVRESALADAQLATYDRRVAPENVTVQMSVNFDNIQGIDLKEGTMVLIVWFRLIWTDPLLAWNDTQWELGRCFRASEDLWTPDIVFYNGLEVESGLSPMSAQTYPDGSMFWSRPGQITILCDFKGLENFPDDELTCSIDLSSWFLDGIEQNIIPWETDGGFDWKGKGGKEVPETFQDYTFKAVSVERVENYYSCCPGRPYIMLRYHLTFSRSTNFYFVKLVVPQVMAAIVSWLTFWMHPEVGERIGFGITLILTVVAFDWVASEHTPICNQSLMLNVLTQSVGLMIILSLVESTIVLYIYFWKAWTFEHYIPYPIWLIWSRLGAGRHRDTELSKKIKLLGSVPETDQTSKKENGANPEERVASPQKETGKDAFWERAERIRLYRRAFFMLDSDHSARLDPDEVNHFGEFMMGKEIWNEDKLKACMNGKEHVSLTEFCKICDDHMRTPDDDDDEKKLGALVEAFTQSLERAHESEQAVSQEIANKIDKYCRWLVPPIELLIMILIMNHDYTSQEA